MLAGGLRVSFFLRVDRRDRAVPAASRRLPSIIRPISATVNNPPAQTPLRRNAGWLLCALLLCCFTAPRVAAEVTIDAAYPGGNIIFERIDGDNVYLRQDLRDTPAWWFYWNFRVRGAAGRTLTFRFTNNDVIDLQGPSVSLDEGTSWSWLGSGSVSGATFTYTFGAEADSVRFCYAMPYQEADLLGFLAGHAGHPHLAVETLCQDRSGRDVERLRLGKIDGEPQYRVALTCRHHCCEMMASWVLEGILAAILAGDEDGQWFQQNVEVVAVPFMDKDGVEAGDQGKNRAPHDHARDYIDEPIYPTVQALREFLPAWSEGKLRIALDLHDPYIHDNKIFWVLNPDEPYRANARAFLDHLDAVQQGPLTYSPANDTVWPSGWEGWDKTPMAWFRTVPGVTVSTALEMPYSTNAGMQVTPDRCRAFGQDIARAIRQYLLTDPEPPGDDGAAGPPRGAGRLRDAVAADPSLIHHYTFEGATDAERRGDKKGSADLAEVAYGTAAAITYDAAGFVVTTRSGGDWASEGSGRGFSTGAISLPATLTVEALIRPDQMSLSGTSSVGFIIAQRTSTRGYFLLQGSTDKDTDDLSALIGGSWSGTNTQTLVETLSAGHWYYVANSFQISGGNTTITTHVADLTAGETTLTSASKTVSGSYPLSNAVGIGLLHNPGSIYGDWQSAFPGAIDEVALYNSVLDTTTLQNHLDLLLAPPLSLSVEAGGSDLLFTWGSVGGRQYDLLSATSLATPPDSPWPVYTDIASTTHENIPASGTGANLLTVPRDPAGSRRFFALREEPAP